MLEFSFIALILLIFVIIIKRIISIPKKDVVLSVRKNQIKLRDNPLKRKLEESIEKNTKVSKKYELETLCLQAGYEYTYGEYFLICILFAAIAPVILLNITVNYPLAAIVSIIASRLPKSILKKRRKKRKEAMERQIGAFLEILTHRYKNNPDLCLNIVESLESFSGQEPFYSELGKVVKLINYSGYSPVMALDELVRNTGNRYLSQFKDSYEISQKLPSEHSKDVVLNQAKEMYEVDSKLRAELKEKISGPVNNSYFILACIPGVMVYQAFQKDDYINFMLNDPFGKVGLTVIVLIILAGNWIIQNKVNAPLIDD